MRVPLRWSMHGKLRWCNSSPSSTPCSCDLPWRHLFLCRVFKHWQSRNRAFSDLLQKGWLFFSLSLFFPPTASAYAMSDFQLTSLPDEVTPQSEIWFCSERSCWWSVMKRNRAVWQKLLWSGSGEEPKHLLFTCLSTLNLSGPSEAELRAAVAIETKQDGQYCQGRGWRSGMNRLSHCVLWSKIRKGVRTKREKKKSDILFWWEPSLF